MLIAHNNTHVPWATQCIISTNSTNSTLSMNMDATLPAISLSVVALMFGFMMCFYGYRYFHVVMGFVGK